MVTVFWPTLARLQSLLRDHPIIVVGYRGSEESVMGSLFRDQVEYTNRFAHGVYWCILNRDTEQPLTPAVRELAHRIGSNFSIVPTAGFDDLVEKDIWEALARDPGLPSLPLGVPTPKQLPRDMRIVEELTTDALDRVLLFQRLGQYANKLHIPVPDGFDAAWTVDLAKRLDLLRGSGSETRPTLAGLLLFAPDPSLQIRQATIVFSARGSSSWLRQCFGHDVDLVPGDGGGFQVEQRIRGNLWAQLDTLTELLSLVNSPFRLKGEISEQVHPFVPLALKEVIVNALVHRDYDIGAPISVRVSPEKVVVESPGGLVEALARRTEGETIERAIKANRRGLKGYRNPVISDLLYWGGQMDRAGSGLSDMWKATVANNADVAFGPTEGNGTFVVAMEARREAVDRITNTAVAEESERFVANLLAFHEMPDTIWFARMPPRGRYSGRVSAGMSVPAGRVYGGTFYTLYNLGAMCEPVGGVFYGSRVEEVSVAEFTSGRDGENVVRHLLYEALFAHLASLDLVVDHPRKRVHFPRLQSQPERRITYQGRVRRATRTVVKARRRRNSEEVAYYEHKAVTLTIMTFGLAWAVALIPGYSFTRDGVSDAIGRHRTNVLSTKRAARDFNTAVHHDVAFWLATLSGGAEGPFGLNLDAGQHLGEFAPRIVLSNRLPSVAYRTTAFDGVDGELDDLDVELDQLAEQIEEMAQEERVEADGRVQGE